MEDELRLSLLVLGGCFIVGVLVHGLWVSRKNKQQTVQQQKTEPWSEDADDSDDEISFSAQEEPDLDELDELGLGKPRVVSSAPVIEEEADEQTEEGNSVQQPTDTLSEVSEEEVKEEVKLYGSVVTQPKPHLSQNRSEPVISNESIPEPPGFLLHEGEEPTMATHSENSEASEPNIDVSVEPDFQLDTQPSEPKVAKDNVASFSEQAKKLVTRKKAKPVSRKRQEPKLGEDQMHIDFNEPQVEESKPEVKENQSAEQEVLVLNVKAPEDAPIAGAALLPMLLTLGFKFGDQDIFHRHVNSNGKGPVLFSLANMFKPGVFDIDNLENFTTQGVSLFMILPIDDPHQVFNMMHNAARKIADEFGAQVLDGRRSVLTKQGLQQYVEKIRDFERRRMIARWHRRWTPEYGNPIRQGRAPQGCLLYFTNE